VLLNSTSPNTIKNHALVPPENFVWRELSPISYEAHVESKGSFVLVLLESYDEHWKVSVNGNLIQEKNHQKANAFANCWLIDQIGDLAISIQYETQNYLTLGVILSVVLPVVLLIGKTRMKRWLHLIRKHCCFLKQ
jgi:hypothetical protein